MCWVAALALSLAAMAGSADAVAVRAAGEVLGPHLQGARVVWGEQERGALRARAADAGGARQELGVVAAQPGRSAFGLALGGGGVAVSRASWRSARLPGPPDRYAVALLGAPR